MPRFSPSLRLAPSPSPAAHNYNTRDYYADPRGYARQAPASAAPPIRRAWFPHNPSDSSIDYTIPPAPQHAPVYVADTRVHDDRYGFPNHPSREKGSVWMYIFAVVLPPLPVFVRTGCGWHLLLNFVLLILGWIPAIIHAFYVLAMTVPTPAHL